MAPAADAVAPSEDISGSRSRERAALSAPGAGAIPPSEDMSGSRSRERDVPAMPSPAKSHVSEDQSGSRSRERTQDVSASRSRGDDGSMSRERSDVDQTENNQRYFPSMVHNLRACLGCRLIMTKDQFLLLGCPTCDHLNMKESEGRVVACTTTAFQGFIANIRPGAFVSRFNGLENNRPGVYALSVQGKIPDSVLFEEQEEARVFGGEQLGEDRSRSPERANLPEISRQPPPGRDAGLRRRKVQAPKPTLEPSESDREFGDKDAPLPAALRGFLSSENESTSAADEQASAQKPARKRLKQSEGLPATPANAPSTPSAIAGSRQIAPTPTGGIAPTPAGGVPLTPAGPSKFPSTPVGAGHVPNTPGGAAPASPLSGAEGSGGVEPPSASDNEFAASKGGAGAAGSSG